MTDEVHCPKCNSTQVQAFKRGYSLLTGFIGSNQVFITCLSCGNKFKPGEKPMIEPVFNINRIPYETDPQGSAKDYTFVAVLFAFIVFVGVIYVLSLSSKTKDSTFLGHVDSSKLSPTSESFAQLSIIKGLEKNIVSGLDSVKLNLTTRQHYIKWAKPVQHQINVLRSNLSIDDRKDFDAYKNAIK